jgi:tRNA(Ile)-lysidine synthase
MGGNGGKGRTGRRASAAVSPSDSSRLSRPALLARIRHFIRQHNLISPGSRVLAAVSGGSDSMALAYILRELASAGELRLAGLIHFNHQLRPAADDDERFVATAAWSLDVPLFAGRGDVPSRAAREGRSIEDAARAARHEFFERARIDSGADLVALGHTRDDQAETFLLRLLRGAGPRGLASMHPKHGTIVRPLLACRRGELRAWLAGRRVAFVDDETNADVEIARNRVRLELLPLLAERFNPGVVDVLADEAELAGDAWAWMDAEAAALVARVSRRGSIESPLPTCQIDAAQLAAAPVALQRAVLWRAMSGLAGSRSIGFHHVEAVRRLLSSSGDAALDAPGQRVERIGGSVVLTGRRADAVGRPAAAPPNLFRYPLSIPGEVALSESRCIVSAEPLAEGRRATVSIGPDGGDAALVRGDLCGGSLAVRNRRPGDRFRPVGLAGRKKLQDYFVDRKVARRDRDAVPIVVDESDRIVWVVGHGIDEAFRVTDASQAVLLLTFKPVGGPA